ncbi:hypothetical protein [Streptomyces flavofungini]
MSHWPPAVHVLGVTRAAMPLDLFFALLGQTRTAGTGTVTLEGLADRR